MNARTSFQRSQRSTVFAPIAQLDFVRALDTLPDIAPAAQNAAWQWQRLRHLTVGPFRGFRQPEPFNLAKRIVLFYGPNGSGKTVSVWNYLNKGTHEEADRDDFESERVEEVVMTLEELEALNIRPNR